MNERIKELRKNLNLTLEKFGKRLGVGKTAIFKIEKGENTLTEQMLLSICREYNVSEEWLRTGSGEMFEKFDRDDQLTVWAAKVLKEDDESFRKRFVASFASLDEDDWKAIERIVNKLIANQSNKD